MTEQLILKILIDLIQSAGGWQIISQACTQTQKLIGTLPM